MNHYILIINKKEVKDNRRGKKGGYKKNMPRSSRSAREFTLAQLAGMVAAVLLLAGILVFIILVYTKDTQPNLKPLKNAINNISLETNLSALIPPTCLLYQYDVPYICGLNPSTVMFDDFVEGTYASTMMIMNPYTIDITYSKFITASIPQDVQNNTENNVVLTAKYSDVVFNCNNTAEIFMIDIPVIEREDEGIASEDSSDHEKSNMDNEHGEWEQTNQVLHRPKRDFVPEIVNNGHHMAKIKRIKRNFEEHNVHHFQTRAPADFYAGVFSVTSAYSVSVWGIQTTIDTTTSVPTTEIVPATSNCILYDT